MLHTRFARHQRVLALGVALVTLLVAPPTMAALRLNEIYVACDNGDSALAFVEIRSTDFDPVNPRMGLQMLDGAGNTLLDATGIFAGIGNQLLPAHFVLLGTSALRSRVLGATVDKELPRGPATGRGRIVLYQLGVDGVTRTTLDAMAYGGPGEVPAPAPGHSLQRSGSAWAETATPTPQGWWPGTILPAPGRILNCVEPQRWRIEMIAAGCVDGDPRGSFVQLVALEDGVLPSGVDLYVNGPNGGSTLHYVLPDIFASRVGQAAPAGSRWLLSTASDLPAADGALGTVDPAGGFLGLFAENRAGDEASYGPIPPGTALLRDGATWSTVRVPHPLNFAGDSTARLECWAGYYDRLRIRQLMRACANGSSEGGFVELRAVGGRVHVGPEWSITVGGVNQPLDGGRLPGGWLEDGQSFLIAPAGFEARVGLAPDMVVPAFTLDEVSGVVSLSSERLPSPAFVATYPSAETQGLGLAGGVALRPGGDPGVGPPAPRSSLAGPVLTSPCFFDPMRDARADIAEIFLRCRSRDPAVQFVELSRAPLGLVRSPGVGMRAFDHAGASLFDLPELFAPPFGVVLPPTRALLLGTPALEPPGGPSSDRTLPAALDTLGGRIEVYVRGANGTTRPLDALAYGPGGIPIPHPGASLVRQAGGTFAERHLPTPLGLQGQQQAGQECFGTCPEGYLGPGGGLGNPLGTPLAPEGLHVETRVVWNGNEYDMRSGTLHLHASGVDWWLDPAARARLADEYVVMGPAPGTPLELTATIDTTDLGCDRPGFPPCDDVWLSKLVRVNGLILDTLGRFAAIAGEPFRLDAEAALSLIGLPSSHTYFDGVLRFTGLPPGAHLESCYGYDGSVPVATEITLAEASLEHGVARLRWYAGGARPEVSLERASSDAPDTWTELARVRADGDGFYAWEDQDLPDASRVGYRLAWTDPGGRHTGSAVWLDVGAPVGFALHGVRPNPGAGARMLAFALDRAGEVRVDVHDVAGRRVLTRRATLSAGEHVLPLARTGELAPGVYLVRLAHGGRALTTRAIVSR